MKMQQGNRSGSQNALMTLFQHDPAFLALVDPSPVVQAMDELLQGSHGVGSCHIVTMKGWRNRPGYKAGAFHCDEMWGTENLPAGFLEDLAPQNMPAPLICTALTYLNGSSHELCPTRVIPFSHCSGRRPVAGESSWRGQASLAAIAKPGDCLIFRCDVWHASSSNTTKDAVRLCVETAYGARKVAQKFWPYLDFQVCAPLPS